MKNVSEMTLEDIQEELIRDRINYTKMCFRYCGVEHCNCRGSVRYKELMARREELQQ